MSDKPHSKHDRPSLTIPVRIGDDAENDYGKEAGADFGPLARDRIPVRVMKDSDVDAIIDIDRRITGRGRPDYFRRKVSDALHDSDVRVSLVAELDGRPVGFIMARVDFGEFGRMVSMAVMDTLGVDPDYNGQGVGRALMSQLLMNLKTLRIDGIRTEIDWSERQLASFLDRSGFRPSQRLCLQLAI